MFVSVASAQTPTTLSVLRIIDGDTVIISAPFLPDPLNKQLYLRINGVDTPESGKKAKCVSERNKAAEAKEFVEQEIYNAKTLVVQISKWDKYGGRVLGDILINDIPLSQKLIDSGLAREYNGEKKKGWCRKWF